MPFSKDIQDQAWQRAGGKCECTRQVCGHGGRCNAALTEGKWHAHHVTAESVGGAAR